MISAADFTLRPGDKLRLIADSSLQVADIICVGAESTVGAVIKEATYSPFSHVAAYIGKFKVVEALMSGVEMSTLSSVLDANDLVVAFRHGRVTPEIAIEIKKFLLNAAINNQGYNFAGAVGSVTPLTKATPGRYFCSQLVCAAYNAAGLKIAPNPDYRPPRYFQEIYYDGVLRYVGHLKSVA